MGVSCGLAAAAAAGVCRPADLLPTPAVAARSKRLRWPISTQAEPQQICSIDSWQSGVFPSRRGKPWNSPCCFPKQMPVCSPSHLKGSSCLFNGLPPGKPSLLVSHKKSKYYLMNWLLHQRLPAALNNRIRKCKPLLHFRLQQANLASPRFCLTKLDLHTPTTFLANQHLQIVSATISHSCNRLIATIILTDIVVVVQSTNNVLSHIKIM